MSDDEREHGYIFLLGNVSEGFTAHGVYETLDDACAAHDFDEGWVMKLNPPFMIRAVKA